MWGIFQPLLVHRGVYPSFPGENPDFLGNFHLLALDSVAHSMCLQRKTTSINYIQQGKAGNCLVPGISKQGHFLTEQSLSCDFSRDRGKQCSLQAALLSDTQQFF